jgi:hypothetical protein
MKGAGFQGKAGIGRATGATWRLPRISHPAASQCGGPLSQQGTKRADVRADTKSGDGACTAALAAARLHCPIILAAAAWTSLRPLSQ